MNKSTLEGKANLVKIFAVAYALVASSVAWSVPVLQVGAPGGAGEGAYANYVANSADPTETDTAITNGNTIYVAGIYQNNKVLNLGGQSGGGSDWGGVNSAYAVFNGKGAVIVAAVPEGFVSLAAANLKIGGASAFRTSEILSGLFPNNHDPLKDGVSDFLFFDIGNFAKNSGAVPNFADETGAADGEIKSLALAGTDGLDWIHFDVMALETSSQGQTSIVTTIENNPGSHDVTWKTPGDEPGPDVPLPAPTPLALMGLGAALLGLGRRRFSR